jgi:hypothetical protein
MSFRRSFAVLLLSVAAGPLFADGMPPDPVPVWPMAGTDADVRIYPDSAHGNRIGAGDENIRIISRIGADMTIENNIGLESAGGDSFSGGADMTHPYQAPAGFNMYENQAEMPFMHSEMPEDDGASVLSVSKSNRKPPADRGMFQLSSDERNAAFTDYAVDNMDERPDVALKDQVRSWVVAAGQNLREVLQTWCDKEGWDLIWNTPREYPIAASAVFKGRFLDVSSALVRNFSRAAPIPYAKFYKGNRVLVISTTEDN